MDILSIIQSNSVKFSHFRSIPGYSGLIRVFRLIRTLGQILPVPDPYPYIPITHPGPTHPGTTTPPCTLSGTAGHAGHCTRTLSGGPWGWVPENPINSVEQSGKAWPALQIKPLKHLNLECRPWSLRARVHKSGGKTPRTS